MAITADTPNTGTTGSGVSALSYSHTVGAGSNNYLVALSGGLHNGAFQPDVATVLFGLQSLTQPTGAKKANWGGTGGTTEIWSLKAATTGSATLAWTFSQTFYGGVSSCAFFGVDQTTPVRNTADTATASSTAPAITVNSASGDMCVAAVGIDIASSLTTDSPATVIGLGNDGNCYAGGAYSSSSGATRAIAFTANSSHDWGTVGISLVPASSASAWGAQLSDELYRIVQGN